MNILVIKSSVFSDGNSSALVNTKVDAPRPNTLKHFVERDLATDPVPHLDGKRVGAFFTPEDERSAEQQQVDDFPWR